MLPKRPLHLRMLAGVILALAMFAASCGSTSNETSATGTDNDATTTEDSAAANATEDTTEATDDAATSDETTEATEEEVIADAPTDRTVIRWFVGLGTGTDPAQIPIEDGVVAAFNASQDDITLEVEYVDNDVAVQTLATQLAAGNGPDIVGPVGIAGSNAFAGQFLDLESHIASSGFDLSVYEEAQVEFWREDDGALTSIPFATFPSFIFYNRDLFDEAGLDYPPQEFGVPYADGDPWDMDKLQELAEILTVDANGNDATSGDFDPESTIQYGFHHQWGSEPRAQGTFFGAGSMVDEGGKAQIPNTFLEEWQWFHSMIHEVGASPTQAVLDSELLNAGNTFTTGNVAMVYTHLWYTCCLRDDDGNGKQFWDLAVAPSYNGTTTAKLHADGFRIMETTENPDAAFTVLSYFLNEGAGELLGAYGAAPARPDLVGGFFDGLDESYPQGVNWDVALASQAFPDTPSHEGNLPNFAEATARIGELEQRISSEPDLDVVAAAEELRDDLQLIFDAAS